jgi:hypothetical protein
VARHRIGHGFSGRIPAGGRTQSLRSTTGHRAMGMLARLAVT